MSDLIKRLRETTEEMAHLCGLPFALWNEHSNAVLEAADRIEQLEADMRRLEQIYNRDQVAQVFANEIETIFDRWALKLNATERY
jgi:hypothetical protein